MDVDISENRSVTIAMDGESILKGGDPADLLAHIEQRRQHPDSEDLSLIELLDGRVLERHVLPQRVHGQCVGSVITFRDITLRVQYEQKMLFNHLVLENSPPMFWIDRDSAEVTYANPAACRHLGYDLEELLGMRISEYDMQFGDDSLAALDDALRGHNKPVSFVTQHRRKDGVLRDVRIQAYKTETAAHGVYIINVRDITEQQQAEQARKRQAATLASLINSMSDIIFYKDRQGHYLGCNDAFLKTTGRRREDVIGKTVFDVAPAHVAQAYFERDEELYAGPGRQTYDYVVHQLGGGVVDLPHQAFHLVIGHRHRGGVEGVGFDDVGAGIQIGLMNAANDIGAG